MQRNMLCDTCGMLFIFEELAQRNFWMKNTLIPLDMYFYDTSWKLVDYIKNMRPESETAEPMNYNSSPAQYVVEVNAWSLYFEPEIFNPRECL